MRTLESIQEEIEALDETDLFGTAKEVSHLPEILDDDEHIKYLTSGLMDGTTWLIVCTQKRIVLVDYGFLFGVKQSEMALENINSITYQTGLLLGSIEIWHGGAKMLIENCQKYTVKPFVEAVNAARKALKNGTASGGSANVQPKNAQGSSPIDDVMGQLERLAALKEKGVLTDEEFAAQKAKILGTASETPKEKVEEVKELKEVKAAEEVKEIKTEERIEAAPPASVQEETKEQAKEEVPEPAPKVYENPKEEFEVLFYDVVQKAANDDFTQRFLLADKNPKKILAAVKAYAKNCAGENALLMYDDSTFGNGKVGMLLTNKKMYVGNSFETPVEIELSSIRAISATPKSLNSFIMVNEVKIDTAFLNKTTTVLLSDFLQKAVPLAMQIQAPNE